MYCNRDRVDEIGAPVGSWAACSISEAAYGALDHPVNGLEDSPLMNLQVTFFYLLLISILILWPLSSVIFSPDTMFYFAVQEVFKCHKASNSGDHVGFLFLSKNLKKHRFGLEYASLEVKPSRAI
jgi:DNA-directed RNA polymerase-4 subunit 1